MSPASTRYLNLFFIILAMALPAMGVAQTEVSASAGDQSEEARAATETVSLTVEGISSTSSEDNPGILYILPWQPPTLPRRTRGALETNASELLEPMDPTVFERHQNFHQSLNPSLDSTNSLR